MAWTREDIDVLRAAIASGTTSVAYADKSVTYRTLDEMFILLRRMEEAVLGVPVERSIALRAAKFVRND